MHLSVCNLCLLLLALTPYVKSQNFDQLAAMFGLNNGMTGLNNNLQGPPSGGPPPGGKSSACTTFKPGPTRTQYFHDTTLQTCAPGTMFDPVKCICNNPAQIKGTNVGSNPRKQAPQMGGGNPLFGAFSPPGISGGPGPNINQMGVKVTSGKRPGGLSNSAAGNNMNRGPTPPKTPSPNNINLGGPLNFGSNPSGMPSWAGGAVGPNGLNDPVTAAVMGNVPRTPGFQQALLRRVTSPAAQMQLVSQLAGQKNLYNYFGPTAFVGGVNNFDLENALNDKGMMMSFTSKNPNDVLTKMKCVDISKIHMMDRMGLLDMQELNGLGFAAAQDLFAGPQQGMGATRG